MASEVVMYQLMFVLGISMLGFLSVTFNNYDDFADVVTLESNLEEVAFEVGQKIVDVINQGRELISSTTNFAITMELTLEAEYAYTPYNIEFGVRNGVAEVRVSANNIYYANYSLGYSAGTGDGLIDFQGNIVSSSASSSITYAFDSTLPSSKESMILSS